MKASYVQVGIHRVGSYGSADSRPSTYVATNNNNNKLGFVADYDKDGWTNALTYGDPYYSGDYFVPGTPVEG